MDKIHTERRRYQLIEAEAGIIEDAIPPMVIGHYVEVDFWSGTIKLPEGKFELGAFMRVVTAIRTDCGRYQSERRTQWPH